MSTQAIKATPQQQAPPKQAPKAPEAPTTQAATTRAAGQPAKTEPPKKEEPVDQAPPSEDLQHDEAEVQRLQNIWGGPDGTHDDTPDGTPEVKTETVKIEPWGTGKNDSVWGSLNGAGFTDQQIIDGKLVDEVGRLNDLEDPNVVQPGQELKLPSRGGQEAAPPPAEEPSNDPTAQLNQENAASFNRNFETFDKAAGGGQADGKVSTADLEAIASGEVYAGADAKATAQYYLDNPDRFQELDNAGAGDPNTHGDNLIAQGDVDANLNAANTELRDTGRTEEERKAYDADVSRQNDTALATLEQNFENFAGKDGQFTRAELLTLSQKSEDPKLREAAAFMLDHPDRLSGADAGDDPNGKADGTFTLGDLQQGRIDTFNELRLNPDQQRQAEVAQQQAIQWDSPQAALANLQQNGDLSTYSQEQLAQLAALGETDPAARELIAGATGNYITQRTNSLDDLPGDQGFQYLVGRNVVGAEDTQDPLVKAAQDQLKGQVNESLGQSFTENLDGKSGKAGLEEALKGYNGDLRKLAEQNPSLVPYLQSGSQALFQNEAAQGKLKETLEAGLPPTPLEALGGGISGGLQKLGDWTGDALEAVAKYNPTALAARGLADNLGLDWVKDYQDQLGQGLDRFAETAIGDVGKTVGGMLQNPGDTLQGLYNLSSIKPTVDLLSGKNPLDVINERGQLLGNIGEAAISDYKETWQKDGVVSGLTHITADIATTVLTGGTTKIPKLTKTLGEDFLQGAAENTYEGVTNGDFNLQSVFGETNARLQEFFKNLNAA